MNSQEQRINDLFSRIATNQISDEELREFFRLLEKSPEGDKTLEDALDAWWDAMPTAKNATPERGNALQLRIIDQIKPRPIRPIYRWAAAAAVVIVALWLNWQQTHNRVPNHPVVTDIQPGSNKATITIGNHAPVTLSTQKQGVIAGDQIRYNDGSPVADLADAGLLTTNKISTPNGGQYHAVLPDGTKVWLNAASSIRFPSRFNGAERRVQVSGEVYLEVAANASQPFFVETGRTAIQVLGTSFNVNAYTEEETEKTTLVSGGIRVAPQSGAPVILQPADQSVLSGAKLVVKHDVNIAQETAWRQNRFSFVKADLPGMMRQLSRWYDVKVVIEGKLPERSFSGEMGRDLSIDQVMHILGKMNIQCRLENRTLYVSAGPQE